METRPYNTPAALQKEPFTAAFWILCAPFLFPVLGAFLIGIVWPGFNQVINGSDGTARSVGLLWAALAAIHLVHFAILSIWSERIGAGAFAGSMRASQNWIIAAILLGPVILIVPNLVAAALAGGEQGWEYSSDVDTSFFAPENWGVSYLVFALVLAPILEEVTFRGVALGAMLVRGVPPFMAAAISSAAFTFLHLQYSIPALLVVFVAGMGFAWLRLKSGSMLVPILAHIAANGMITFLASLSPPAG
ncbi:CPBP family intramembrane glutamic endopeptidase [Henriciella marina]|uniref:CPBP family intramembrane glutamic endopeptidase n=1 Tax=Henriciella marina TaxID=453851 RepID=UPI0003A62D5D|nr:CPBP family intramembrane glutamic endopeptidase [Henriciella marina]